MVGIEELRASALTDSSRNVYHVYYISINSPSMIEFNSRTLELSIHNTLLSWNLPRKIKVFIVLMSPRPYQDGYWLPSCNYCFNLEKCIKSNPWVRIFFLYIILLSRVTKKIFASENLKSKRNWFSNYWTEAIKKRPTFSNSGTLVKEFLIPHFLVIFQSKESVC